MKVRRILRLGTCCQSRAMVALITRAIAAVLDHHPLPWDASNRILGAKFQAVFSVKQGRTSARW
jgi:hypothetical protein